MWIALHAIELSKQSEEILILVRFIRMCFVHTAPPHTSFHLFLCVSLFAIAFLNRAHKLIELELKHSIQLIISILKLRWRGTKSLFAVNTTQEPRIRFHFHFVLSLSLCFSVDSIWIGNLLPIKPSWAKRARNPKQQNNEHKQDQRQHVSTGWLMSALIKRNGALLMTTLSSAISAPTLNFYYVHFSSHHIWFSNFSLTWLSN